MQTISLSKNQASGVAVKKILWQLQNAISSNEAGVIKGTSDESLHDFRVALRQTRTMLRQVRGVLPDSTVNNYHRRFTWLASVTSASRDIEVLLDKFDELVGAIPENLQPTLDPLREQLEKRKNIEQKRLTKSLISPRYQKLKQEWRLFLSSSDAENDVTPKGTQPIKQVIDKRVWKLYRRVIKEGKAIKPRSLTKPSISYAKTAKNCATLFCCS